MYKRTDEAQAVIEAAGKYYTAMMDADARGLREVFHPKASVIGNLEGELEFASLDELVAITPDAKTGDKPFEYSVERLFIEGDTAVITVKTYCFETRYSDHLSLLRIDGDWKIVAKVFYAHPES